MSLDGNDETRRRNEDYIRKQEGRFTIVNINTRHKNHTRFGYVIYQKIVATKIYLFIAILIIFGVYSFLICRLHTNAQTIHNSLILLPTNCNNKEQKLNDFDLSIKQFQLKSLYYDIWKLSNGEQRYIHFDVMNQLHSKLNTTINYILIGVGDSSINSRSILETFVFHNNSNISNLYHGIMIEALPRNYNILKNVISKYPNMKDRTHLLNIGVSNKSGNDVFHGIDVDFMKDYYMKNKNKSMSEVPNWMKYQLGSFKTDGFHFQRWPTTNITINITTLSNIYNKQYKNIDIGMDRNGAIDILHIDTEGFDYIILKSFLESYIFAQLMDKKLNPTIINFERKLMNKDEENEIVNILDKYGYTQRRLNRGDDILAIFKPMKFKSHEWMKELSIPKPNKSNNVKQ